MILIIKIFLVPSWNVFYYLIGSVFWWEVYYRFLLPYNGLPVGIPLALLMVDERGIFVACEVCVYQYLLKIHHDYLSQTLPGKVCIATAGGECCLNVTMSQTKIQYEILSYTYCFIIKLLTEKNNIFSLHLTHLIVSLYWQDLALVLHLSFSSFFSLSSSSV